MLNIVTDCNGTSPPGEVDNDSQNPLMGGLNLKRHIKRVVSRPFRGKNLSGSRCIMHKCGGGLFRTVPEPLKYVYAASLDKIQKWAKFFYQFTIFQLPSG